MEVRCPKCGRVIDPKDVNVGRDIAACLDCNEVFTLSELVGVTTGAAPGTAPAERAVDLDDPPAGCSFQRTPDGFTVVASTRSWGAFAIVPFAVAWNSFIAFAFTSVLWSMTHAEEAANGTEGAEPADGASGMPPFAVLFIALFMLPFVAAGLMMIGMALMMICGQVRVSVERGQGEIFTGVFGLGRHKRFDWDSIQRVADADLSAMMPMPVSMPGSSRIVLEGQRRVTFGKLLNGERSYFVAAALRQMVAERGGAQRGTF